MRRRAFGALCREWNFSTGKPRIVQFQPFRLVILAQGTTDTLDTLSGKPENAYLRNSILTATPEQLQLLLYDGAIRYARQAREALNRREFETSFEKLTRAQNIITEMQAGLNYEVNRELCEQVASVYNFIFRKLVDANITRDPSAIDDALKVLQIERETWRILVEKVNRVRAETAEHEDADPAVAMARLSVHG